MYGMGDVVHDYESELKAEREKVKDLERQLADSHAVVDMWREKYELLKAQLERRGLKII